MSPTGATNSLHVCAHVLWHLIMHVDGFAIQFQHSQFTHMYGMQSSEHDCAAHAAPCFATLGQDTAHHFPTSIEGETTYYAEHSHEWALLNHFNSQSIYELHLVP